MKRLVCTALLASTLAMTGCMVATMKSYIGHDVTDIVMDYGPPANAFDLPDGRRAFQWRYDYGYTMPSYASSNGTATVIGNTAWMNTNTTIYGGQPISGTCIYTMIGTWNESRHSWTILEFRKPTLICS